MKRTQWKSIHLDLILFLQVISRAVGLSGLWNHSEALLQESFESLQEMRHPYFLPDTDETTIPLMQLPHHRLKKLGVILIGV